MSKMPYIVWSRLGRKMPQSAGAHPDANLLAAFAEHALLEKEVAAVTAHLAECADCREYLAVAFAVEEREIPAAARPSTGTNWFREWRWIASAAAACCVVAAALQYYGAPPAVVRSTRLKSMNVSSEAIAPPAVEPAKTRTETPAVALASAQRSKVESSSITKPEAPVLMAEKKDVAPQDLAPPPLPSAPPVQATESAQINRSLETPKVDAVSSFVEPERSVASQPAPRRQELSASSPGTSAALPKLRSTSGFIAGTALRAAAGNKAALKTQTRELPVALWSINASPDTAGISHGVVQRSTDKGQTWEIVPLSERVSFRAVAASGLEVWAGGSEGRLFHSSDGGSNWVEINVAGESSKLKADIVRIDVRDRSHVAVTAASGERWASRDGGGYWTRE